MKPNISFVSCSLTRILATLLLGASCVVLLKILVTPVEPVPQGHHHTNDDGNQQPNHRKVLAAKRGKGAVSERQVGSDLDPSFLDVPRVQPKVSLSSKVTLDKLLDQVIFFVRFECACYV